MMIEDIKEEVLKYNNYLLLQGPKGFFFYKLAKFLIKIGKNVYKINFNGGDLVTFPLFKCTFNYRGKLENFEEYFKKIINAKKIDVVLLYGDYRPYHRVAKKVCQQLKLPFYVFEEGYIRPHYITLEKNGINGWSDLTKISRDPNFYKSLPDIKIENPLPNNYSYMKRVISSIIHYLGLEVLRWYFPHYTPCKKYFPYVHVVYCYLRGYLRKIIYKIKEKKIDKILSEQLKFKYFLVPLQVYNDTQITIHSTYKTIEEFIKEILESFARNCKTKDIYLVFKHHPEDRGFKDYGKFIDREAKRLDIREKVFYVHDLHLPTLLKNCCGVIVINSTVGLQALYYNKPVKVMGRAIYDIPGLTFQGSLNDFWNNPGKVDRELFLKFRNFVIKTRQLNGSFYGRFPF